MRALRGEAKSSWKRLVGVESACNVDCRFKLSTHKMLFIVNSEDYMYRRGTLCRAKQVPAWLRGPEAWGLAMGLREGVCPQVPIPSHLGGVRSRVPTDPRPPAIWGCPDSTPVPPQVQPLVLLRHHQHFEEWHGRWLEDNVTVEAAGLVQDWLMGEEDEDMVPCKTLCETARVHGLPVTRYRVQYGRRPASP